MRRSSPHNRMSARCVVAVVRGRLTRQGAPVPYPAPSFEHPFVGSHLPGQSRSDVRTAQDSACCTRCRPGADVCEAGLSVAWHGPRHDPCSALLSVHGTIVVCGRLLASRRAMATHDTLTAQRVQLVRTRLSTWKQNLSTTSTIGIDRWSCTAVCRMYSTAKYSPVIRNVKRRVSRRRIRDHARSVASSPTFRHS